MKRRFFILLLVFLCPFSLFGGLSKIVHSEKVTEAISKKLKKWDLACVMIFRDEAPYLKEWIEYHKLVGVQHFVLYNNLSVDHYKEVLEPYIQSGEVEFFEWSYEPNRNKRWAWIQNEAYRQGLALLKNKATWVAIIDADEFLVPVQYKTLPELLKKYEQNSQIASVSAFWVMFGTSHVEKISEGKLLIEQLLLNDGGKKENIKSIIRPERIETVGSPHYANLLPGYINQELDYHEIQINHYWSRDESFLYGVKIPRWEFMSGKYPIKDFVEAATVKFNQFSEPHSAPILRYVERLREKMRTE